jgi:hypothetical protein
MVIVAKYLVLLAGLISGVGDAWGLSAGPSEAGRHPCAALSRLPRADLIHAPAGLPTNPRPLVVWLGESGLDEEDNDDHLNSPETVSPTVFGYARPLASVPSFCLSVDRVMHGRSASASVLRC